MHLIPVIDLLDGQVVRAQRGEREHYRPMVSALCNSSEPVQVAKKLLELYPFDTLYIADLNAIQHRGNHQTQIADIKAALGHKTKLWLDSGISSEEECRHWEHLDCTLVIGSESLTSLEHWQHIRANHHDLVLSLDWRGNTLLGPSELFHSPSLWPQHVIVMTLAHVGSYLGPDIATLQHLHHLSPATQLYAAGGVRDADDLLSLHNLGIHGALLASSLHDGNITSKQLSAIAL